MTGTRARLSKLAMLVGVAAMPLAPLMAQTAAPAAAPAPNANRSGLLEAVDILKPVSGLAFCYFDEGDVVRHHLVQRIIRAYDDHKARNNGRQMALGLDDAANGKDAEPDSRKE